MPAANGGGAKAWQLIGNPAHLNTTARLRPIRARDGPGAGRKQLAWTCLFWAEVEFELRFSQAAEARKESS
ncbi:MAG: hypothetical protein JOZ45_11780 [Acidobacteriaceae bacterium]|nr:hypothetical protein [Acidobacteriaceae bacterium]